MFKGKLLVMVLVLTIGSSLLLAYSSRGEDGSSLAEQPADSAVQEQEVIANADSPGLIPNTGESVSELAPAYAGAKRLWSGEVFLSENDYPDLRQQTRTNPDQVTETGCISEEPGLPRRHGGCAE